jgi:uncharacterized protein (UPF0147 family)
VSKTRRARRKLNEEDVAELAKVFDKIIKDQYMPVIIAAVDERVKETLMYFYKKAQEANENNSP